ncbi:MAG: DUF3489 domain-containing protein [Mesorhizobium sp.]
MSHSTISEIEIRTLDDERPSDAATAIERSDRAPGRPENSKAAVVLKKLRLTRGVTVAQIMDLTGWQPHSVRGFLSAVVRKRLKLNLVSEIGKDGQRRYRVIDVIAQQAG